MDYPALNELLEHVDNQYTLASIAAKRAHQIIESGTTDNESTKALTIALKEIACGKVRFERTKDGVK
ncbi:MAG TPA: DNA-directed RNA polymerase subunit omega [Firmicutes bacterium]|jgi:DNA-directed RNA polymerase subunit omega|nr:DNA-directed RNA polymerase subunit omega [Bacillota bacterium]